MTPKVSIKNLSKNFLYNGKTLNVLSSISLHLHQGEFVTIVGPSGCGKTTLFHILSGIENETTGTILLDGKNNQNRKGKTGYMFQEPLLLPWRTVLDNLVLGTDVLEIPRKKSHKQAIDLLETFNLSQFKDSYPSNLSGGMKQRVSLLRTLLFREDLLLLDEPFASLDALTRLSCQFWLLKVWQKKKSSILFITHDIAEAILLSDRIYVMSPRPGKILQEFKVDLPRPRKREHLTSTTALNLEKKLYNLLIT